MSDEPLITANYSNPDASERVNTNCGQDWLKNAFAKIQEYGFVVLACHVGMDPREQILSISRFFSLGRAYVPKLYRKYSYDCRELVDIIHEERNHHPVFNTARSQGFHVDGLLEPIGFIPVSMLFCVRPALEGGETVVLNSVGLFKDLLNQARDAARALTAPTVLRRRSTLSGSNESTAGPAFLIQSDGIVNRYSDGHTEEWDPPPGREHDLEEALKFFREESRSDGPRRLAIRLDAGECLLMRNDKISHGRLHFRDDPGQPRHLIRSLYLNRPSLGNEAEP